MKLFDEFPQLEGARVLLHKMSEADVDALSEITGSEEVYRFISPFLYQKSRTQLLTAIRNLGGRDFDKKKLIISGIYLKDAPERLIGLLELFDHRVRANAVTIGYRLNPAYWRRGIATECVGVACDYLTQVCGIETIHAYVMPENIASQRVLLKNGFVRQAAQKQDKNWGGQETVLLDAFVKTGA